MRALIAPSMRKSKRLDVLSVSDMCVDLILQGNVRPQFSQVEQIIDNYVLELGGSANIFISQMVTLGAKADVIGWSKSEPRAWMIWPKLAWVLSSCGSARLV